MIFYLFLGGSVAFLKLPLKYLISVMSESAEQMLTSFKRKKGALGHHEEFVASLTISKAFVAVLYQVSVEEGFQEQGIFLQLLGEMLLEAPRGVRENTV